MDLSLKKREVQVPQDLPQDLSLKKGRSSGTSSDRQHTSHHHHHHQQQQQHRQTSLTSHAKKAPKVPSHAERATSLLLEHGTKSSTAAAAALVVQPPPLSPSLLVEHKSRIVPSLIEQKSRIIPDLDQYIRAMMDLKPIFADQHLRSLAHQKAKTLSNQSKRATVDRSTAALVVPKCSALVIPDPRNRAVPEQRTKQQEVPPPPPLSSHSQAAKLKSLTSSVTSKNDTPPKRVVDFRKKSQSSHTITERLLSSDLHQSDYAEQDAGIRFLQAQSSLQPAVSGLSVPFLTEYMATFLQTSALPQFTATSSPAPPVREERRESHKRRRKQERPRKRVKMDLPPPEESPAEEAEEKGEEEEEDSIFNISEEFLDKVTDAAQNGELSKGLDEYFAQTAQQETSQIKVDDNDNNSSGSGGRREESMEEKKEKESDVNVDADPGVADDQLNDDSADNDGSLSPSSSADGLSSPFQLPGGSGSTSSPSPSPHPHPKPKGGGSSKQQSRVAASLQNREERKALRLYGKEYTTPSGKTYPQRQVRDKDCSRCRYNCSSSVSPEQRQALFEHFWSLDAYVKRLYYYCQSIKEKPAKTMKHTRECSREYTFLVGGERLRVCKGFYLATLDVSDKAVRIAMEKRKRGKGMCDKRGAIHHAHNHPLPSTQNSKTRPEDKDRVRSHIESVLIMDIYSKTGGSEGGRGRGGGSSSASSSSSPPASVVIPGQDLDVSQMHRDYLQSCQEDGKEAVSEDVYRHTFHTEYNLATVQV